MSQGSLNFVYYTDPSPGPTSINLGQQTVRLGSGMAQGLVSSADMSQPGTGSIDVDVLANEWLFTGLHSFYVVENAAPLGQHRMWTGIVTDRTQQRGDAGRASLRVQANRYESLTLVDHNEILSRRLFPPTYSAANRPSETVTARTTWLLSTPEMSLITDQGKVESNSTVMPAADYRKKSPADVLRDMQVRINFMCWARHNENSGTPELCFLNPDGSTFTTTATISNVLADVNQVTTFYPLDAQQKINPSRVFSGMIVEYKGGAVYCTRPATATAFGGWRDTTVSADWIDNATDATAYGNHLLAVIAIEAATVTVTLKLPDAHVNDIYEGHKLAGVKFTHLTGWETGVSARAMTRTVMANEESDTFYNVRLELVPTAPTATGLFVSLPYPQTDQEVAGGLAYLPFQYNGPGESPPWAPGPPGGCWQYNTASPPFTYFDATHNRRVVMPQDGTAVITCYMTTAGVHWGGDVAWYFAIMLNRTTVLADWHSTDPIEPYVGVSLTVPARAYVTGDQIELAYSVSGVAFPTVPNLAGGRAGQQLTIQYV